MDASFWHRCWENNTIGFHQDTVHPFLTDVLADKLVSSDDRVFVPLCGKSLDMFWLAERLEVVGSEISEIACRDFFADKRIDCTPVKKGEHTCYQVDNISLWQGDFFTLEPNVFGPFDWIYDRAAIIALPLALREKYVKQLSLYIADHTKLLLISLEFPESELSGPPFPVFESDIKQLFKGFKVNIVAERKLSNKQFAQRTFDVSYLTERVYIIQR